MAAASTFSVAASPFTTVVPVAPGSQLRITANGTVALPLAPAGCTLVGPRGCAIEGGPARLQSVAPAGSLVAKFLDANGADRSPIFFVGDAALVVVPPGAARLAFAYNLVSAASGGIVVTVADVAPSTANAPAGRAATRRGLATARLIPIGARFGASSAPGRQTVQHLLRRLGFSAAPESVTAVAQTGTAAWLAQQLNPAAIDDSAAINSLQPKPTTSDAKGMLLDPNVYERRLVERQYSTLRQVQEKLVLHWIDHFSIGNTKVKDAAMMSHYEETLRADALGNFKQLVVDVAKEPAMLIWLDNNNNSSSPGNAPNENFSRELMQLFVMGTTRLNPDGSPILDATGTPIPNYTQTDVTQVAALVSGFHLSVAYTGGSDPNTRFSVSFNPSAHPVQSRTILGQTVTDPGTAQVLDNTMDVLIRNPSTAPFQAKELLQRFATEAPSAAYVAAISQVWAQNVNAPDQIAKVVSAIVNYPEFNQSYLSMSKEPAEIAVGLLRQLPGVLKYGTVNGKSIGPGDDIVGAQGFDGAALQELYTPPSVFSFYRPGNKDAILSEQTWLARTLSVTDILQANPADPKTNTAIDTTVLRSRIGLADAGSIATYLLDALVDGGTPDLRTSVLTYLGTAPDDSHLRGAVWLIATAPEYEAN